LRAVARPLQDWTGLPEGWALLVAGLLILSLPLAGILLIGPELSGQLHDLGKRLPDAIAAFEQRFGVNLEGLVKDAAGASDGSAARVGSIVPDPVALARTLLSQLSSAGSMLISAAAGLIILVVGGSYLASSPSRYREGVVQLFPVSQQRRIDHALGSCGIAIDRWLKAQLISMVAVGALTGAGAWALGLPAPLAIAFLTGVLEFIPILGPWLGAVPVLLLAVGQDMQTILLAAALIVAVQQLESNLITPLAQQSMAEIPPFLILFGLLAFGMVFGIVGVLVSGPLTLVAYVLVTELYVRDTLGQDVAIPGRAEAEAASERTGPTASASAD
ncbi:MAG: AI-2E family transporter, partial [Hyphomicrobiaceae bacterium]